jgi:hypothetical protein
MIFKNEYPGNTLGTFQQDLLIASFAHDWDTHAKAFAYLCGVDLHRNSQISTSLRGSEFGPRLSESEEIRLTEAILTYQHEMIHYFQTISTASCVGIYFLDCLYRDFCNEFAKGILDHGIRNGIQQLTRPPLYNIEQLLRFLPNNLSLGISIMNDSVEKPL